VLASSQRLQSRDPFIATMSFRNATDEARAALLTRWLVSHYVRFCRLGITSHVLD
jgi:hypothetical protein